VVEELGGVSSLAARTVASAIRPPHPYGAELVEQFGLAVRVCWLPLLVCAFAAGYGPIGVQAGELFHIIGAEERTGAVVGRFSGNQLAPLVAATVVAAVAGGRICVDLGAREARRELDALDVLGVELVKSVVVPRFVALLAVTPLFAAVAQQACIGGALLAGRGFDIPLWEFVDPLLNSSAGPLGVFIMCLKAALFGGVAAVVACSKGLSVARRPDGIGRAVGQALVLSAVLIFLLNYVVTYLIAGLTPDQNVIK
jgi:phospholipid/cholesterol/gamma-HCH transport system permease protein